MNAVYHRAAIINIQLGRVQTSDTAQLHQSGPALAWLYANIRTSHCLICQNLNINYLFVCRAAVVGGGLQRAEKLLTLDGISTTTAGINTSEAELDLLLTYP